MEEQDFSTDKMELVWSILLNQMYLDYNIEEDFMEQFTANFDQLVTAFNQLREIGEIIDEEDIEEEEEKIIYSWEVLHLPSGFS
ncbi:MAG: hypothetical protein FWD97_10525 [Defluviitaleaceae bacterium]|nr:hypothetical protein [Defluviitaleaceae bacterium]